MKLFQKENGLETTGVYDAAMHAKLTADESPVALVPEEKPVGSAVQIFAENGDSVNIRCGNSTDYKSITTTKPVTDF